MAILPFAHPKRMVPDTDITELPAFRYNQLALRVAPIWLFIAAIAICLLAPFPGQLGIALACVLISCSLAAQRRYATPYITSVARLDLSIFVFYFMIFCMLWYAVYMAPTRWSSLTVAGLATTSGVLFSSRIAFLGTAYLGIIVWLAIRMHFGESPTSQECLQLLLFTPAFAFVLRYAIGQTNVALQAARRRERDTVQQLQEALHRLSQETERRLESESQLRHAQKTESLGLLAAGVAHDFNNALLAISAFAENIRLTSENTDSQDYAGEIVKAVQQASSICQQMLTYAGRTPEEHSSVSLCQLAKSSLRLLQVSVKPGVVIRLDCETDGSSIRGNATQLQQVLMNLISNAADAIEGNGTVRVTVSKIVFENDLSNVPDGTLGAPILAGTYYQMQVEDSGSGMSEETMHQMFDPYFTTKSDGHGFGLSVVLGIVRSHNATVSMRSEVGKGTKASLLFPAEGAPVADLAQFRVPRQVNDESDDLRRILVVDDDDLVRTPMAEMLRLLRWEVVEVCSGREAVEEIKSGSTFSVMMIDYRMPEMNGQETLKALRAVNCDAPAVLCSGYISEVEQHAVLAQFDDFLPKPFRRERLEEVLRAVTSK